MTRLNPSLFLNRLVVRKGDKAAYDEQFHIGVNVIRSDGNSRGKSTIADLIFFALGGDLTAWKDEAASCDFTLAEVSLSGSVVTLKREIRPTAPQKPMWIFYGRLADAELAGPEAWARYTYRRFDDRESFTQVLFRVLGLPEVPAEDANITMYQLLRLMYVDQMTPVNRIFRFDPRDAPLRRQAVGDLLCGLLDPRIYPAQMRVRQLENEYSVATQQLSGLLKVLRSVDEKVDFSDLLSKVTAAEEERAATLREIERLRLSPHSEGEFSTERSEVLSTLKSDLDRIGKELRQVESESDQLKLAIEDSDLLVAEIERSLSQLRQARLTSDKLGALVFAFCPSCFSPITGEADPHHCHLCKADLDPEQERSRYARMQNELEIQLKESVTLQRRRKADKAALDERLTKLRRMRDLLATEYFGAARTFTTEISATIDKLTRRMGFLDRELIDLDRERRVGQEVAQLSAAKEKLNDDLTTLRKDVQTWIDAKERRQGHAYRLIASATSDLLNGDTKNDVGKVGPEGVYFDFTEDRVEINGKSGYSASTLTVIRNAFHLALLVASCQDKDFGYPRFLLMDNIEDKGMTPERSQNFQRLIIKTSGAMKCDHQIIFTTSMPDASVEAPKYAVGEKYSATLYSLKV
jgi:hypothetical protein